MEEFTDENDHIYKQSLELIKQNGFNIQLIKTVSSNSTINIPDISKNNIETSAVQEKEIDTPETIDVEETIVVDEDDQLNMFDKNLNPIKPPVDIYNIPNVLKKDCWETPQYIKNYIYNRFGLNGYMFDPCPVKPKVNGLLIDWEKCSYVNPPYSRGEQIQWVKKAIEESKKGKDVYVLIPSDTSTKIWNDYVMKYAYIIYFVRGRIQFVGANGMPKFGNTLVYFNGCTLGTVVCETINFKDK